VKILGIDPGYGILGWSVINDDLTIIDYGVIRTESSERFDSRLLKIHTGLKEIISTFRPDCVSIEKIFFSKSTSTAMDVSKTIGVILLTTRLADLDYHEYTPSQVKQAITGFGRADKEQMQAMIRTIFRLDEIPRPDDAADALAIAACHSFKHTRIGASG